MKKLYNETSLRKGFYTITSTYYSYKYTAYVEVVELENYTNGYCRVKINDIRVHGSNYTNDIESGIRKNFEPVKLSSDITWLEQKSDKVEDRKRKLKRIMGWKS